MPDRVFGAIPGVAAGSVYPSRLALAHAGVHKPTMAGISGSQHEGADSIVVSGGYVDDQDHGNVIIYTGDGGNDSGTKRQIADQELTGRNLALAKSADEGLPVRVTRGSNGHSPYAPVEGYRYDGLYYVESYWPDRGADGYRIFRYRLVGDYPISGEVTPDGGSAGEVDGSPPSGSEKPNKTTSTVQRVVRSTQASNWVKQVHEHRCQVCGIVLETPSGRYAEGAHIRPLGTPHDGPDTPDNILCLCPNCHVIFDRYAIYVDEGLAVRHSTGDGQIADLRTNSVHVISSVQLAYHRSLRIA